MLRTVDSTLLFWRPRDISSPTQPSQRTSNIREGENRSDRPSHGKQAVGSLLAPDIRIRSFTPTLMGSTLTHIRTPIDLTHLNAREVTASGAATSSAPLLGRGPAIIRAAFAQREAREPNSLRNFHRSAVAHAFLVILHDPSPKTKRLRRLLLRQLQRLTPAFEIGRLHHAFTPAPPSVLVLSSFSHLSAKADLVLNLHRI